MLPLECILVRSVDQVSILWISNTTEKSKEERSYFYFIHDL